MVDSTSASSKKIGILTGPTATGKSQIAIDFALQHGKIELINADSLLVYQGMNIGTAKPSSDELKQVPHHLIDIRKPDQPFTAGEFFRTATRTIEEIESRGNRALIVGGTGFYLKSLLFGLWEAPAADLELRKKLKELPQQVLYDRLFARDAEYALRIGKNDSYRLVRACELMELTGKTPSELQATMTHQANPRFMLWVIDRTNDDLFARIAHRTRTMLQDGLIEEVKALQPQYSQCRALSSVGYLQTCQFLAGEKPPGRKIKPGLEGLSEEIQLATRQLVKQQRTWFRRLKTQVFHSQWFNLDADRPQLVEHLNSVYD
jgi:tRNA dimethylallyltransferase